MVRLGQFKKEKKRIRFRDWVEQGLMKEGIYRVIVVFPPLNYPSFSLVFIDDEYEVRLSIKAEKFKEALKSFGITVGKRDLPSILVIVEKDCYGIDIDADNQHTLAWRGSYWRLERVDDIPF